MEKPKLAKKNIQVEETVWEAFNSLATVRGMKQWAFMRFIVEKELGQKIPSSPKLKTRRKGNGTTSRT